MTTTIGTRERLLRAAEKELIRSHGHLEMQAVAKRAQVSVGLAYHRFGSKAGLIAAVVEAFYSRLDEVAFEGFKSHAEGWAERKEANSRLCRLLLQPSVRAARHRGVEPRARSPGCRDRLHQTAACRRRADAAGSPARRHRSRSHQSSSHHCAHDRRSSPGPDWRVNEQTATQSRQTHG
ncbi:helix-turn-helix transcriptional regulator [Bradyrhizobium sp. WSM 1791]|uniref:Helix-turn-helix transcriptional regulator n=1 Tax=Bradyrhizobium australiense TaxID=2721161 RepID=A0A7Y4GQ57_9BRAD|nr:helix-turn-helix transcriptional regulator [Bradyrhizobium australiense]